MGRKEKALRFFTIFMLALQLAAPVQAQAAGDASRAGAEEETWTIRVEDGVFCCFSEDGVLEEEKTNELREAAQTESDIAPLLELIGEPEETEYFGQGCWFGKSGKEPGEDGAWYYDGFVVYVYKTNDLTYYMSASAWDAEEAAPAEQEENASAGQAGGSVSAGQAGKGASTEQTGKSVSAEQAGENASAEQTGKSASAGQAGEGAFAGQAGGSASAEQKEGAFAGQTEDRLAEQVEAIVRAETAAETNSALKLRKLFQYVEREYGYARKIDFEAYEEWPADYALEMIADKAGSCYHYAALYGFLAHEAGYDARVCVGTTSGFASSSWQQHAWTEVEIDEEWYAFDTNMDQYGADASLKYYRIKVDSDRYAELYKVEETYAVLFETEEETEPESEAETEPQTEAQTELQSETETEPQTESESKAETESQTELETESQTEPQSEAEPQAERKPEAQTEAETESQTELQTETQSEAQTELKTESQTELHTESQTEPQTEPETEPQTDVEVTEEGVYVWTLDNRSELTFKEARLADGVMMLVDADGVEHRFSEVEKEDIQSPHLVMYGSFLAVRYTSAKSGKSARLVEDGDEITFKEPQPMKVLVTAYVRSGAGLENKAISVANKGTEVKVIGETGKWYKLSLRSGAEGYISKIALIAEESLPSGKASAGGTASETETETEPKPETVIVQSHGRYYRYERFVPAEDTIVEIGGAPCYVTAGGAVSEGWKVLGEKLYYSDAQGRLKCAETFEGITFGEDGAAENNTNARLKMRVIQIVNSITDDTMTKSQKLSACWSYVTRGHLSYAGKYPDLDAAGWQRSLALDALTSGSGNCYGFACAFAALAEGVGYQPEVVCGRVSGSRDGAADGMTRHSWVKIDGCYYDPEAQWAGWCPGIYGYSYYPVTYSVQRTVSF